jgi:acetyl esterase/lipase
MGSEYVLVDQPPRPTARIAYGEDPSQFGDLRLPIRPGRSPLVIFIHGGYYRARFGLDHASFLCHALTMAGLATWSIEYRRLGNPGGGWPGTFQDILQGITFVRNLAAHHPLDLDRVLLMGHSAGGHLALWAASAHRVPADSPVHEPNPLPLRAGVSLAGLTDLRWAWELQLSHGVVGELLGGDPEQVPERYAVCSPLELLPAGLRQVVLHGMVDRAVPHEMASRYHAAATAAGDEASLILLPNIGHFEPIDPRSDVWPVLHEAVTAALD